MLRSIPLHPASASTGLVSAGLRHRAARTGGWITTTLLALFTALAALAASSGPAAAQAGTQTGAQMAADPAATVPVPTQRIIDLVRAALTARSMQGRIEILPGQPDTRLKLAPCNSVEPYLPAGAPAWGRTRVGLRCMQGPVAWNIYLPVTVRVWSEGVVAATALPAGTELTRNDLRVAEIDIAATGTAVFTQAEMLVGRRLTTAVNPGTPLRAELLRVRQWFAAGEPVTLTQRGDGYAVSTQGQALGAGIDGMPVRVRLGSGAVIVGTPVGDRLVEVRS